VRIVSEKYVGRFQPHQFPPQLVKPIGAPFDGGDRLFEIKRDGFRTLAIRDGGPLYAFDLLMNAELRARPRKTALANLLLGRGGPIRYRDHHDRPPWTAPA
jgi:hypothetical protein